MNNIFEKIAEDVKNNFEFVICIATNTHGSVPRSIGAKMIVYSDGKIFGTIGGGKIEKKVIEDALAVLDKKKPALIQYDLLKQLQMCCGGSMEVYFEPVMKKNKLYIFGAGHTGRELAKRAIDFDFEITMIDDRKEYIEGIALNKINTITGSYNEVLPALSFDDSTYITIMTYSHPYDREILSFCLKQPHAYIGMMGSKRKVEITKKMFIDEGIGTKEELQLVDMPMGIDIDADGPEEISISILAKLLSVKNKIYA